MTVEKFIADSLALTDKQVWLWPQKAPGMCGLEPL